MQQKPSTGQTELSTPGEQTEGRAAVAMLHLLGRVPIPGVVIVLAVLLSPEPADFTIFLEILGPLLQSVFGQSFSEWTERTHNG